jgi:protein O-mannosyl-transferase
MQLANKYRIALLILVVLGLYYPAIHGPINPIDDIYILEAFGVNGKITLKEILFPGGGFYFRPLINLSYYLDNLFWDLDPSFMHLENILLHGVNTLLIYLITRRLAIHLKFAPSLLPLASALIFAVHPINVEAVAWIAGRTDPMAALFTLLSTLYLVKYLDEQRQSYIYISVAFLLFGVLAKEVAILFLPIALFLIVRWPQGNEANQEFSNIRITALKLYSATFLTVILLFTLHLVSRKADNSLSMITSVFSGGEIDVFHMLRVALQTFGFYIKKFFVPFPLNFAIVSISWNYAWLGLLMMPILVLLSQTRNVYKLFLLAGIVLISPALLVALTPITWTPVAERYLYLPSAYFSIGLVGLCNTIPNHNKKHIWLKYVFSFFIICAALASSQRILLWQNNLALLQDTMRKSPDFGVIRNQVAIELISAGKIAECVEQLKIGAGLNNRSEVQRMVELNQIAVSLSGRTHDEARAILLQHIADKKSADIELLKMLRKYDQVRLEQMSDKSDRIHLAREIIDTNDYLY